MYIFNGIILRLCNTYTYDIDNEECLYSCWSFKRNPRKWFNNTYLNGLQYSADWPQTTPNKNILV